MVSRPLATFSRRRLLERTANGFGGLALASLCACRRMESPQPRAKAVAEGSSFGKAKRVIFLFMSGGPGQMDTFDPKPRLAREHGQQITIPTPRTAFNVGKTVLKSPFRFRRYGEVGADVSELFPHLARSVDRLAIVRSTVTNHSEHAAANYFLHSGWGLQGRPSAGAWVSYALGSENEALPAYVVLEGGSLPFGGLGCFSNGFLPARHRATLLRQPPRVLADLVPFDKVRQIQDDKLALVRQLDQAFLAETGAADPLESVIASYELAARMQHSIPEALDFSRESRATTRLYGLDDPATEICGAQCLLARRLVERGVRFVQLLPPPLPPTFDSHDWDQHAQLDEGHRLNALAVDRPIAGLLEDLDARGLLDDTVVLWAGEFGRTPMAESRVGLPTGRDHNPFAFTIWLAGGGVKRGLIYGATDEYGMNVVENPVHVHDLHATLLHLLGIDHEALTFEYAGREFRLTDVEGRVVHDLFV